MDNTFSMKSNLSIWIKEHKGELSLLIFLLALLVVSPLLSPYFLTMPNILNLLRQISYTTIAAIGMLLVILMGGIDLSIGATIQVVGMSSILLLIKGVPIYLTIIIVLIISAVIGLINGLLITYGKLQPFIVTLVSQSILGGVVLVITNGSGISGNIDKRFLKLGAGYVGSVPIPVIITLAVLLVSGFIMSFTVFGRKIYVAGSNKKAAFNSGVNVNRLQITVYILSALLAALSGILTISRTGAFQPSTTHGGATGMELNAIAAVVVGGAKLSGGKGTVLGTFLGALLSGLLSNLLVLMEISSYIQQLVLGLIILFAVVASAREERKGSK